MKNREKIRSYIKARLPASVKPDVLIGPNIAERFTLLKVIAHKDEGNTVSAEVKVWWYEPLGGIPKKEINKVIKTLLQQL